MSKTNSLTNYLKRNILLPFAIFGALLSALASTFYWFALDDTAEFYLFDDAYQFLENGHTVNTGARFVSSNLNEMPQPLQAAFANLTKQNHVTYLVSEHHDNYLLKYREFENSPTVYVAHRFTKAESLDIRPVLVLVCLFGIVFFALWLMFVMHRVRRQMQAFVSNINARKNEQPLQLSELNHAQSLTLSALENEHQAIFREKAFASFLSHEVRHPLTLLGHQLAHFDHLDDLNDQVLTQIEALKKTQRDAVEIAHTILTLWDHNHHHTAAQIDMVDYLTKWQSTVPYHVTLKCHAAHYRVRLSDTEMALLLSQINSNFCKYGVNQMSICISDQQVSFTNQINPTPSSQQSFGVGSFIIKALATKAGLDVEQKTEQAYYSLILSRAKAC